MPFLCLSLLHLPKGPSSPPTSNHTAIGRLQLGSRHTGHLTFKKLCTCVQSNRDAGVTPTPHAIRPSRLCDSVHPGCLDGTFKNVAQRKINIDVFALLWEHRSATGTPSLGCPSRPARPSDPLRGQGLQTSPVPEVSGLWTHLPHPQKTASPRFNFSRSPPRCRSPFTRSSP